MKTSNNKEKLAQGADSQPTTEEVNVKTIERWLDNDLKRCLSLLNAIHSDPDLKHELAVWMHGRYITEENRKKLQPEIPFPDGK